MRTTSIADLKRKLSAYLAAVQTGEEIIVTDRGRPVAKVVPIGSGEGLAEHASTLVRTGAATPPSARMPDDFWQRPRPHDPQGVSLAALLDDRTEGR